MGKLNFEVSSKVRREQMKLHAERMMAVEAYKANKISLKEALAIILK